MNFETQNNVLHMKLGIELVSILYRMHQKHLKVFEMK
jgi:hypothetical protein